jgi:hypothetical protein
MSVCLSIHQVEPRGVGEMQTGRYNRNASRAIKLYFIQDSAAVPGIRLHIHDALQEISAVTSAGGSIS